MNNITPLKLHIISDLHNEFRKGGEYLPDDVAKNADVIILAGDIGKGANGISWASGAFPGKTIIYVPGNHEYYGRDIMETKSLMHIMAHETGVILLDDDEYIVGGLGGVRFLGCTLWTDFLFYGEGFRKSAMLEGQKYLNDFQVIHYGRLGHFSPSHSVEFHEQSLAWLKAKLDQPFDGKTVVISHHLPSARSVSERFEGSTISPCFASNLDDLFGKMELWIHGHTHDSKDYVSNGTRVICNPYGYHKQEVNSEFNRQLIVEI
jgi:predicted phosphodiesterase